MAGLTTHVLDVTRGGPARGVRVDLYALGEGGARALIASVLTNADGRTDKPLIPAAEARVDAPQAALPAGTAGAADT